MSSESKVSPETLRERIQANAVEAGMPDSNIFVAHDGFGGYLVRVVHASLAGLSESQRSAQLLKGVAKFVSTSELITPDEVEWYGPPFAEATEQLPLWPEMLELPQDNSTLTFVTDLDDDIEVPAVVTFYSLRGGVGRTTTLAAAAKILAERGRRVLCVDMDLEAPGLSTVLGCSEPDESQGVLPLLLALERGDDVDIRDHVQLVAEGQKLYCMPSGRLGRDYAERLRLLDPEIWYRETANPLYQLLDKAKESSLEPEIILLDARTGISPISAPLLFDVSDLAVICFFPHPQAARGTELLTKALLSATTRRSTSSLRLTPEPRFLVSPLPPGPSAEAVRSRAVGWIDDWVADVHNQRAEGFDPLRADEITHAISYSPDVAYGDHVSVGPGLREPYIPVAEWLDHLLPQAETLSPKGRLHKRDVLRQLDFSTGTAENQQRLIDDFVQTKTAQQAMDPKFPLVLGRKGTGKTAIFRWLLEKNVLGGDPVAVFSPHAFRSKYKWSLGAEALAGIEQSFTEESIWPTFWKCYTALAIYFSLPSDHRPPAPSRLGLSDESLAAVTDELDTLDVVKSMLSQPMAGPLASRWLKDLNDLTPNAHYLLYDGLDTGFGGDAESRLRRTRAVSGLMAFLTETEPGIPHFPFKVMLRVDIWRQLQFQNKSHLFGRYVQLMWRDQNEYLKTILKQAVRSEAYREMLTEARVSGVVDGWGEDEVRRAWNILLGERMKGEKTTFTRNWVWNRLADGQGDHGPRSLSQLFHEAVQWEIQEEARTSYDRSIVRSRALVPSLGRVSVEALQALQEEFPELNPLVEVLRTLRSTPISHSEIGGANASVLDRIDLALEVGLLTNREGPSDDGLQYKVPDLYRLALGLTRRGQA